MTWELIGGAILGLAALGYVLVALIDPERFS
ncbi:potassium-transporting ATPase subunit F [Corynebacterium amycolatum]|uniref:Potassium-transporting ATPase subunit F n=1 Tax=Corynebacterium amycolatum TaxID=43765 RepID=A0AAW9ST99_CORAY|nr:MULTISPECIES: potassium-transporting ATPase subunit F [Corynebacterium]MBC6762747.1 potassium-transporting ATPase subunit F [Corynebacterium sp. LK27]MCQ9127102.1 potassium-transporting ATPase subunit F [Corynebacterium amycolatum]MCQ9140802.1 potassium-transporting ATPase subunit F [Corynebacterium amycolatum]MCQ9171183.1 potassium-transporting ATPase subunit F [Corynebacterium amycolatum]MDK7109663.1 potassium-transporting ATPase subunit F [Corynebacterium amycolatum]